MTKGIIQVDIEGYPELLHGYVRALARILREEAKGEPSIVREFADRVAADLEASATALEEEIE